MSVEPLILDRLRPETARWIDAGETLLEAITIDGQRALIPADDSNPHWQEIKRWRDKDKRNRIADAPPALEPPPPQDITAVQLFHQLALQGDITEAEAEARVSTGTLPRRLVEAIGKLPADEQFGARMKLRGASVFDRRSPLAALLGSLLDKGDGDMDAIWRAASAL